MKYTQSDLARLTKRLQELQSDPEASQAYIAFLASKIQTVEVYLLKKTARRQARKEAKRLGKPVPSKIPSAYQKYEADFVLDVLEDERALGHPVPVHLKIEFGEGNRDTAYGFSRIRFRRASAEYRFLNRHLEYARTEYLVKDLPVLNGYAGLKLAALHELAHILLCWEHKSDHHGPMFQAKFAYLIQTYYTKAI